MDVIVDEMYNFLGKESHSRCIRMGSMIRCDHVHKRMHRFVIVQSRITIGFLIYHQMSDFCTEQYAIA